MDDRPRYMISVAADIVGMHPQTLRIYENKGLIRPKRTAGNTRLYSEADIQRLQLIQQLTNDLGLNLAGVEQVLQLQDEVERMTPAAGPHAARDARGDRRGSPPVPPRPRAVEATHRPPSDPSLMATTRCRTSVVAVAPHAAGSRCEAGSPRTRTWSRNHVPVSDMVTESVTDNPQVTWTSTG